MIIACKMVGDDRCSVHGHDAPCSDRKIMTAEEYSDLQSRGLIEMPRNGGVCYICEGTVRTITCGEDSWEIRCRSCDFLYSED